jgi:glycosyltransferase involved in cell wall biosynthesis
MINNQKSIDKKVSKIGIFLNTDISLHGASNYQKNIIYYLSKHGGENLIFITDQKENLDFLGSLGVSNYYIKLSIGDKILKYIIIDILKLTFKISINTKFHSLCKLYRKFEINKIYFLKPDNQIFLGERMEKIITIFDLNSFHQSKYGFMDYSKRQIFMTKNLFYFIKKEGIKIILDCDRNRQILIDKYGFDSELITYGGLFPRVESTINKDVLTNNNVAKEKIVLYVAAFWKHKNHKTVIEAFKKVLLDYPTAKLFLVGEKKQYYKSVLRQIRINDVGQNCKILNNLRREDLFNLMKRSDIVVYASLYGLTNLPPLEAAMLGCKQIVSVESKSNEEIYGKLFDAKYFDPKNSSNLASEILVALKNIATPENKSVEDYNKLIETRNDFFAKDILKFIS